MSMRSALAHFPIPFLAMAALLSACQPQPTVKSAAESVADLTPADPEPPLAAAAEPVAPAAAVPEAFAGRWFVSAVYPVGTARASLGDRHLGASLVIGASEVSDINGQRCVVPELVADRNPGDLRLGTAQLGGVERLTVTCKGKSFATYLLLPGRKLDASYQSADAPGVPYALLADRPEGQYLLERAEQVLHRQASLPAVSAGDGVVPVVSPKKAEPGAVAKPFVPQPAAPTLNAPLALTPEPPVPVTAPEPAPTPAPAPAVAAVNPAAAATGKAAKADAVAATGGSVLPASGTAIHLASYQGISAAKRGWKTLLGEFDALDPLSPLYVDVDVAGKGRMVRLYATGGDRKALDTACTALLAKGAYCVISR